MSNPIPAGDATRGRPSASPVRPETPADREGPADGVGLCLSGGGYRAMVFALGTFIRLNELGWLPKLKRISSVSGGSIASARLGLRWTSLVFQNGVASNLFQEVVDPIRRLASRTIDLASVGAGALLPGSASERVSDKYGKHLFGDATLQDLPNDSEGPRFVINATNVQTGVLWRFSRPYMGDYLIGLVNNPKTLLADAVAASSAFPPILSPAILDLDPASFSTPPAAPYLDPAYRSRIVLTDGGVYDNLGIETVWKNYMTVLVADAGAKIGGEIEPKEDWARHSYRVMELVDNQVRCLRKRQVIDSLIRRERNGAYWGIRTNISDYGLTDALSAPFAQTLQLAAQPTRLKAMEDAVQERVINWGYAVCDAAMRRHVLPQGTAVTPPRFPYAGGV